MKITILAAVIGALALPVAAQTNTLLVDKRQAKVQAAEDKAKADGVVTAKERAKLAKKQNKQSKKIYKEKHDKQTTAPKAS
jgi:acyl-CoA synthetase (AMP-forming)/AMP-acid ligase II